jgi:hypothetical protein
MDWLSPFKDRGFAQLGRTMRRLLTFFESEIANWRSIAKATNAKIQRISDAMAMIITSDQGQSH